MKVVSWDVGIKNLAYCIIENTDDNEKPYIIHKLDVINIIEDNKCSWNDCSCNIIKTTCSFLGDKMFFCKSHKSYHNVINSKWENIKNVIKDCNNKEDICCICQKNAKFNLDNKFYCTNHKTRLIKKWDTDIELKKFNSAKVKGTSIIDLKLNLVNKLDSIKELLEADEVCIENQPAFKNPRMKAISDTLYTWFVIRGMVDAKKIKKINFISPSNKLKIEDKEDEINEEIEKSSNKYKTTKKLSIEYCKEILKYNPDYIKMIEKFPKQDDCCDTIMMAIYYFKHNKK
jgi:hypothetical protein